MKGIRDQFRDLSAFFPGAVSHPDACWRESEEASQSDPNHAIAAIGQTDSAIQSHLSVNRRAGHHGAAE